MQELSMNILDIAQNSISAQARHIEIIVETDRNDDKLTIKISDDGKGMAEEMLKNVTDPFFTTRTTRNVGLGVPFFKMAAEMAGGSFSIDSEKGRGTSITATFVDSHIDRAPLGDMAETMCQLICLNEQISIRYTYCVDGKRFVVETGELTAILDGVPLNTPQVMQFVRGYIKENMDLIS